MSHERLAVSTVDLDDLDLPAFDAFLASRSPTLLSGSSREETGQRLGLLARVAPRVVPTVVGLYVFGKLPQAAFSEWGLGATLSSGTTITDPIEAREDIEGPLGALVDRGLRFVARGTGGADRGQYDLGIVREALVNALVHRDLRKTSRVLLRIFRDRLEIWSPGGPPDGLSDLEEVAREGGISQPRNPLLASVARHLGFGEQLGRGAALIARSSTPDERVELRTSARDVCVVLPARWQRPLTLEQLS